MRCDAWGQRVIIMTHLEELPLRGVNEILPPANREQDIDQDGLFPRNLRHADDLHGSYLGFVDGVEEKHRNECDAIVDDIKLGATCKL